MGISGIAILISGVAWIYPLYQSVEAIKHKRDQESWLMYWIVYALVQTFFVLIGNNFLFWLPFYDFIKLGVYFALWHPATTGAEKIFHKVISPYLDVVTKKF